MTIRILITGGTIDDVDYESIEKAPKNPKTHIPRVLKQSRITYDYVIEELFLKDSRFMTDEEGELILKRCRDCKEEKIIITHGTWIIPKTAKFLGRKNIPKTIVLVGSIIPVNKKNSDALFNLGAAFTAVQTLPKGVYVTMNGKVFSWENVKKEKGYFVTEK